MDDSHSQSGREDVASLGDQTLGEVPRPSWTGIIFATRDDGRGKKASPRLQAAETRGQAAARGQFALFDKGRALEAMLLSLREMGKEIQTRKRGSEFRVQVPGIRGGR
ncbi:MAG: hypothetical protein DMF19_08015 [Verrucomicrobia bacterium]|nr:MAG: hypothetical protein DMF19_08015 [Verrucomicrobiota bacterium]